jgi:hypothetical protein
MNAQRYEYIQNGHLSGLFENPDGDYVKYEDYKEMSDYADSLVEFGKLPCLPKDLENLRAANGNLAMKVQCLQETLRLMRSAKNAEELQRRTSAAGSHMQHKVDTVIQFGNPTNPSFS